MQEHFLVLFSSKCVGLSFQHVPDHREKQKKNPNPFWGGGGRKTNVNPHAKTLPWKQSIRLRSLGDLGSPSFFILTLQRVAPFYLIVCCCQGVVFPIRNIGEIKDKKNKTLAGVEGRKSRPSNFLFFLSGLVHIFCLFLCWPSPPIWLPYKRMKPIKRHNSLPVRTPESR